MYQVEELSESVAHGSLTSATYCMHLTTRSSIITFTCIQKYRPALHSQMKKRCKKHNSTICWRNDVSELCLELYAKITALGLE